MNGKQFNGLEIFRNVANSILPHPAKADTIPIRIDIDVLRKEASVIFNTS